MMRNNQVLQSLGISALTSILNKSNAKSKGSAREDSDSLYEPEGNEVIEQGVVDKVFAMFQYFYSFVLNMQHV